MLNFFLKYYVRGYMMNSAQLMKKQK